MLCYPVKKTKLFWCGIFVTVLGALSLFGTTQNAIVGYQNYLNIYSHGIPATVNTAVYLNNVITGAVVFGIIYSVLTGVGVYVAKMGIKLPETQTAAVAQTESALVK